jgi:hypothetical protein
MTSWKPNDFRDRSFSVGDLVELRDQAEKGFWIVYRVRCICADGALQLDDVSANDGLTVAAEDIHASVFAARPGASSTAQTPAHHCVQPGTTVVGMPSSVQSATISGLSSML